MIVGLSGAGKSVLAQQLGKAYALPVCHLDRYYWKPGWQEIDPKAFKEIHTALVAQEQWIIEGNSMMTFQDRISAADTIIYLDLPRVSCLWRVIKRRFFYAQKDRTHRPAGCSEKVTWKLVCYVLWHFRTTYHPKVVEQLEQAKRAGKEVHVVTSFKDVENFIQKF